jgi:hypothetical protein
LIIIIPTELVFNPKKYIDKSNLPTKLSILVKEEILRHEFHTNSLNVISVKYAWNFKLWINNHSKKRKFIPVKSAKTERIPCTFLRSNLHPVWYEVSDNGEFIRDKDGNKVPHFERPVELTRLSMAEKFLIQSCSNYVPSVHLSNGTFALKGH